MPAQCGSGEMANTLALGASAQKACGFKSRLPHQTFVKWFQCGKPGGRPGGNPNFQLIREADLSTFSLVEEFGLRRVQSMKKTGPRVRDFVLEEIEWGLPPSGHGKLNCVLM